MAKRPTTLLRLPEVLRRTGFGRSTLYKLVADGGFPKPLKLSVRASAWVESEVEGFIQSRIAQSREGE